MIVRFVAIFQYIFRFIHTKIDPLGYARSIGVKMGKNVRFYGMSPGMFGLEPWLLTLGNNVHITHGVLFIMHDGSHMLFREEAPEMEWVAPITVGNDVFIGMRSIIMPGVTIGNRCIIGAGSVVTRSIPDNSVAAGVPARVVKSTDEYLESLKKKGLLCGHLCGEARDRIIKNHYGIT